MEAAGTVPRFAVRAPEVRALAEHDGDIASVYLTTRGDIENASQLAQQRWRALRESLAEQGAPSTVLERIDPLVPDAHTRGACLAAFADAHSVVHVEHGSDEQAGDVATWSALPLLAPLVKWRQASPPYVLVVADRVGADITVVGRRGSDELSVDGDDFPVRKVDGGGWSQRRFQQRAENTWDANAREVADRVRTASDAVNAELIVVAGDVRARQLLEQHLPDRLVQHIEEVPGGRGRDGSADDIEAATQRWVAAAAARATVELLEQFREERGQRDRASDGVEATIAALNAAQVGVLLLHDDARDDRRAWFGSDATPVGTNPERLRDLGVAFPRAGRLADVALRAALGTGAGVWIVPRAGGPTEGVGAVLRWA